MKCLTCFYDSKINPRVKFYRMAPPPARKHMNIEPFSTTTITVPQIFCTTCAHSARGAGWTYKA